MQHYYCQHTMDVDTAWKKQQGTYEAIQKCERAQRKIMCTRHYVVHKDKMHMQTCLRADMLRGSG